MFNINPVKWVVVVLVDYEDNRSLNEALGSFFHINCYEREETSC
jgi:hypothetical protein